MKSLDKTVDQDWKELLAKALIAGKLAAEAIPVKDSGGSCNFDCPYIYALGKRKSTILKVVKSVGLRGFVWRDGSIHISGWDCAQGFNQTQKAEAFRNAVKSAGWSNCSVYYAMD